MTTLTSPRSRHLRGAPKSWRGRFAAEPRVDAAVTLRDPLLLPPVHESQPVSRLAGLRDGARAFAAGTARVADISGITALRAQRKNDREAATAAAEARARQEMWRTITGYARELNARGVRLGP